MGVVSNVVDWSLVGLQFLLGEFACKIHFSHFHHLFVIGGCMLWCFLRAALEAVYLYLFSILQLKSVLRLETRAF